MSLAGKGYKRHRSDLNQKPIVQALRKAGALVHHIGEPGDLLVQWQGDLFLLEVKQSHGKFTPAQEKRRAEGWNMTRVESVELALQTCCGISFAHYPGDPKS